MSEEAQAAASHTAAGAVSAAAHDAATCLSNTNIPQVTAGLAPPTAPGGEPGKWRCDSCTYQNYPLSRKCIMCRTGKPGAVQGEDIFDLQDHASALPPSDVCPVDAVSEKLKPLRISSPPLQGTGPSSARLANKWACCVCTYENWPKALRCAMCGAGAAPEAPSPVAARLSRPSIGINDICNSVTLLEAAPAPAPAPRRAKRTHNNIDWIWLQACLGVVENSAHCVDKYLAHGGDPSRALTAPEVALLNRASAFDPGHTLVHLAIRFKRQEILATLLSGIAGGGPGLKRSPSYIAPDLARGIRSLMASSVRYKKGPFPCRYLDELCTFSLPCEIEELPAVIQEQLFSELLDREVQDTLENREAPLINWNRDLRITLGSRLFALWNRSAGDCLPDAVSQAAFGVCDRDNSLRAALAATLHHAARGFLARWMAWERLQAQRLEYLPEESQLRAEWARLVAAAPEPGTPLHQVHVWVLCHVMRRPLIVYGVDVIRSFRGEPLGYAGFQGIYLPLLWEPSFCSKSPLCLGYTRGHFSALVAIEPYSTSDYICSERAAAAAEDADAEEDADEDAVFVPLTDRGGMLLPVHFLTVQEMSDAENIVRSWTRASTSRCGVLHARQSLHHARPLLQAQMLEEWLNHYRRGAQQMAAPRALPLHADYCSDADADADTDRE